MSKAKELKGKKIKDNKTTAQDMRIMTEEQITGNKKTHPKGQELMILEETNTR